MRYLLDSEVIAAAIKGRLPVVLKLGELKPTDIAVSVVSLVEVESALRGQPRAQGRYGKLLKEFLASVQVLPFTTAEAQQAVLISAYLQSAGDQLSALDLWLAATASARQLVLVTERLSTFAGVPNLDAQRWA